MIGLLISSTLINTIFRRSLKTLVTGAAAFHILLFVAVMIALLVLGSSAPSNAVWESSIPVGGWSNTPTGFMIGLVSMTFPLIGE